MRSCVLDKAELGLGKNYRLDVTYSIIQLISDSEIKTSQIVCL